MKMDIKITCSFYKLFYKGNSKKSINITNALPVELLKKDRIWTYNILFL